MNSSYFAILMLVAALASPPTAAASERYDARLCGADVRIVYGDLGLLFSPDTPPHIRNGLRIRIARALGTLNWLCRRYAAYRGIPYENISRDIQLFRRAFADDDEAAMRAAAGVLRERIPLPLEGLHASDADEKMRATGERLYARYCAACHTHPDPEAAMPARSLFAMAREQPEQEFIARMLGGVKGTPEIGLRNPLSDRDIAGMYAYLKGR